MPTYFAQGSPTTDLTRDDLRAALFSVFDKLGPRNRVLALPPDFTRANSMAGPLTCLAYEYFGPRLADVMPALGTHAPMADWQIARMFAGLPPGLIREHDWRNDVVTIGEVPAEERLPHDRRNLGPHLARPAQSAHLGGRPRPGALHRAGRAARGDGHGQLQQERLRGHGRRGASTKATSSAPPTAWSG